MDPKRRRRFTVLDAIVLIAAVGIGLVWVREFTEPGRASGSYPELNVVGQPIPSHVRAVLIGFWWTNASYNLLAFVTIALLFLRTLSPRPGLPRLTRQPGTVACAAVVAVVPVDLLSNLSSVVLDSQLNPHSWSYIASLTYWTVQGPYESLAVFVAWFFLACSGRWGLERSWVDRFGLILGVFWLAIPPLEWLVRDVVIAGVWLA